MPRGCAWRRGSSTCACNYASPVRSTWSRSRAAGGAAPAGGGGGVTPMGPLPNRAPPVDDVSVVEFLARRAREVRLAKVHTYAAATKGLKGHDLTEMGLLAANGALGFTDGVKAVGDALVMRRVLAYARSVDLLVLQHPEAPSHGRAGEVNEGEIATRLGLAGITPAAEIIMVERDLRLVEITGARYHVAHVSTAAAVTAIRQAKARGLPVTCDTAPPYFALNETAIGDYRTFAKLSPPLRSEGDRRAVIEGLRDGTIDAIASDHAPWDQDSKRLPFSSAAYGIVGLETLLALSLDLYHSGHLDLLGLLRLLTLTPAQILRLPVGRLTPGAPADLVLFDPDVGWRICPDDFRSKSKNAPFDEWPVRGRVRRTVVDGRTIFRNED